MLTKRFVTLFLVFLFPAVLSSSYRRIPLTRGFFSDLTMEVGAPSQKVLVGLSFLTNDFRLICDGDGQKDQYYDPSKSSTMAKVYCVRLFLCRTPLILNAPINVQVLIRRSSVRSRIKIHQNQERKCLRML